MSIDHYTEAGAFGITMRSTTDYQGKRYEVEKTYGGVEWDAMSLSEIQAASKALDDDLRALVAAVPKLTPPKVGSVWRHTNGSHYLVLHVTSEPDEGKAHKFPVTVIYRRVASQTETDGRTWPRTLPSWYASMTPVEAA